MQSKIGMWGSSCAVRLPKMAVKTLNLSEGSLVSIALEDGALVLRPSFERYSLEELVAQAKDLEPPEVWDDAPVGQEIL
jgi:antitoxin component of MazEF toxin-antitoxin module